MKTYSLTAKLLAPVAIKRDRQSDRSESMRSISGTAVRGALASVYLQQHGGVDQGFERLFLDEKACRFGPLDPAPQLFPLTASSCKRHSTDHALVDQLWIRVAQHCAEGNLTSQAQGPWRQCGQCQADLKNLTGFWRRQHGKPAEIHGHRQVAAHVGIDRQTFTAADAMFYTLEAIVPSTDPEDLSGWILLTDDALEVLQHLLDADEGVVYVGHHRTRGYGRVRLQVGKQSDDSEEELTRWKHWSEALIRFLNDLPGDAATHDSTAPGTSLDPTRDFFFALSFPSGAIFVDQYLRYSHDPADMVSWLPPLPGSDDLFPVSGRKTMSPPGGGTVRCVAGVTGQARLRGWNAAHGLPRQDEWMVDRGSVYVYWFQGTEAERESLCQLLVGLAQDGVGLRRNEGFGQAIISDRFHADFADQENCK